MEISADNKDKLLPLTNYSNYHNYNSTSPSNNNSSDSDKSVCSMCIEDFDTNNKYYECTLCKHKMHEECLLEYMKYHSITDKVVKCYICTDGVFVVDKLQDIVLNINEDNNNENNEAIGRPPLNYFSFKNYINSLSTLCLIVFFISFVIIFGKILSN